MAQPKALFFDVFGSLVDWRTGIAREAERLLKPYAPSTDWIAFADAWRGEYQPGMEEVRSGRQTFAKLDILHRRNLERILPRFGLKNLPDRLLGELNLAWHKLDGWPDVAEALKRLRSRFLLAPCSNGNIALMADLARRNDWHWDAILGSEVAGDFKPKPRVYLAACEAFNLAPSECMMVAAHTRDLIAAAQCGLQTGHIARPDEFGPNTGEPVPTAPVDLAGKDLADLATKLRC
ncbi:MAG: Haloacid dehalogenase, type II [Pseudolabrys sp.]|jgi:2-haloacid dehalogenase|nr:Haloacid dehalogenase, type II [Pseudolabrys sp.]